MSRAGFYRLIMCPAGLLRDLLTCYSHVIVNPLPHFQDLLRSETCKFLIDILCREGQNIGWFSLYWLQLNFSFGQG